MRAEDAPIIAAIVGAMGAIVTAMITAGTIVAAAVGLVAIGVLLCGAWLIWG